MRGFELFFYLFVVLGVIKFLLEWGVIEGRGRYGEDEISGVLGSVDKKGDREILWEVVS